jgi:hypothetical protein
MSLMAEMCGTEKIPGHSPGGGSLYLLEIFLVLLIIAFFGKRAKESESGLNYVVSVFMFLWFADDKFFKASEE